MSKLYIYDEALLNGLRQVNPRAKVGDEGGRTFIEGETLYIPRSLLASYTGSDEVLFHLELLAEREGRLVEVEDGWLIKGARNWTTVMIGRGLRDRAAAVAEKLGLSLSRLVTMALEDYLDHLEKGGGKSRD